MIHLYGDYFYTEAVYKYDVRAENVDSWLFLYCIELLYDRVTNSGRLRCSFARGALVASAVRGVGLRRWCILRMVSGLD